MKVITLTGLPQADELSAGTKCTPVEDTLSGGEPVIRCQEDVERLTDAAPPKMATLGATASSKKARKPRRKAATAAACTPKWVVSKTKHGKTLKRCVCGGRFLKNAACSRE